MSYLDLELERLCSVDQEGVGVRPDILESLIGTHGIPVLMRRVEGFAPSRHQLASARSVAIIRAVDKDRRTVALRTSDAGAMTMPFRKGDLISAPSAHEELEIDWVDFYSLHGAGGVIAHAHVVPD